MRLRCGGTFKMITLLLNEPVKEYWKSTNIWQRCGQRPRFDSRALLEMFKEWNWSLVYFCMGFKHWAKYTISGFHNAFQLAFNSIFILCTVSEHFFPHKKACQTRKFFVHRLEQVFCTSFFRVCQNLILLCDHSVIVSNKSAGFLLALPPLTQYYSCALSLACQF